MKVGEGVKSSIFTMGLMLGDFIAARSMSIGENEKRCFELLVSGMRFLNWDDMFMDVGVLVIDAFIMKLLFRDGDAFGESFETIGRDFRNFLGFQLHLLTFCNLSHGNEVSRLIQLTRKSIN